METIQMLGSLGEFVGAIAVVATLVFLAVQVRYSRQATEANTQSIERSQRLAVAQTYQARAQMAIETFRAHSESDYLAPILVKFEEDGLEALTPEERFRLYGHEMCNQLHFDNMHFQFEQGFVDDEYYSGVFKRVVGANATKWKQLGPFAARQSFREEVERILSESEAEAEAQS